MKSNPFSLFAAILAASALVSTVNAATFYWDAGTVTPNGISAGGTGSWTVGAAGWEDGAIAQNWANANDAVLGGTAGTVTLGGAISAASVAFNTTGYTLGLNNLALTTGTLNYGGAAAGTLTITGNLTTAGTTNAMNVITLSGPGSGWASGTSVALTGQGNPAVGSTQHGALLKLVLGNATALGSAEIKVKHGMIQTGAAGMTVTNAITNAGASLYFGGEFDFTVSGLVKGDGNNNRTIGVWAGSTASRTITLGNMDTVGTGIFNFEARGGATPNPGGGFIVNGAITGTGGVSTVGTTQFAGNILTLNGANLYTGATTMLSGRLQLNGSLTSAVTISTGATISGPGSTTGLLTLNGGSILSLPGAATTTSLTSAGITFAGVPTVVFATTPVEFTVYDVLTYGAGTVTNPANLKVPYRGTLTNTGTKFTFTGGAFGQTRTWNTTTGTWDAGTTANWLEGDNLFYAGDTAIFNNPAADSVVTLVGALAPGSVTVNNVNAYTFAGGAISGTTGLVKSGVGTLQLSATNTFSGNVLVSGGELRTSGTNNTRALGSDTAGRTITINSGATLKFMANDTFGNAASNPNPSLIINGTVTNVTTAFTTLGAVTLNNGSLVSTGGAGGAYQGYSLSSSVTATGTSTMSSSGTNSNFHLGTNTTFNVTGASDLLTVSGGLLNRNGDLGGAGGLTKSGAGTVVSSGANVYSGATTVSGGAFLVSGSSTGGGSITVNSSSTFGTTGAGFIGTGGIRTVGITNNGALSFGSTAAQTVSGLITGTGSLAKSGSGVLTLTAFNDYTGPTAITGGTLAVTGGLSASSAVSVASGGALSGNGFVDGAVTVNTGGIVAGGNAFGHTLSMGSLTFANIGASSGAITISELQNYLGSAPLTSTGNLTVSGGAGSVTVNLPTAPIAAGTYHLISSANTLADASQFVLGTAPALGSRQSGVLVANPNFIDYQVSGINPTWTGGFSNEWSTAVMTSPKNWFTNVETDFITGDAVTFDDTATANFAITLPAVVTPTSVTFNNSFNPYSISGAGSIAGAGVSLVMNGTSQVTLNTANTYGGGTTINAGTLTMGNAGALGSGSVTLGAATLGLGGYTVANNIASTGGTLVGTTFQANGVISGTSLTINATGIVKFNAVNTYTGATTITAGGLELIGASQLNSGTYAGAITNPALLRFSTTANQTLSGGISGAGALEKNNASTLTLTGTNTYAGTTTINAGTLTTQGTPSWQTNGSRVGNNVVVNTGGTLRTGDHHQLGWTGTLANLTVNDGGTLDQNSKDNYIGELTLNGNVTISNGSGHYFGLTGGVVNYTGTGSQQTTVGSDLWLQNTAAAAVATTFTVTGTNTAGDLVVSSAIAKAGSLTKAGTGTLVLSGANTYTGTTTVNTGTLALVGGSQKSAITVAGTGALGFNPATPTISTAAVTFNSGAKVTILGTPAAATLMTAASFTGTPVLSPAISGYALDTTTPGQLKLVATGGGYATWATANAGGGPFNGDFDNDGVKNGLEYFMGQTGSSFTPNPALVGGTVSYPRDPSATGVTFLIKTSPDLVIWTDVTASADTSNPNFVKYTPATGLGKVFVRLEVTQN